MKEEIPPDFSINSVGKSGTPVRCTDIVRTDVGAPTGIGEDSLIHHSLTHHLSSSNSLTDTKATTKDLFHNIHT